MQQNAFLSLLREAVAKKWCMQPWCTTCGAFDYRQALRDLAGPLGGPLAETLTEIDIHEIITIPGWDDAVTIALMDLPFYGFVPLVLEAWLQKADKNIRFVDVILYRVIRNLSPDSSLRMHWIEHALKLVSETDDFSLIESLVLVLRRDAIHHAELIERAKKYAEQSQQMRRVLRNACNINIIDAT